MAVVTQLHQPEAPARTTHHNPATNSRTSLRSRALVYPLNLTLSLTDSEHLQLERIADETGCAADHVASGFVRVVLEDLRRAG